MTAPADDLRAAHVALLAARASIERIHTHNGWVGGHPNDANARWVETRSALTHLANAVQTLADSLAAAADTPSGTGRGEG